MFLGHSDFSAKSNDENKMLALLENLCKNVQTDFYLGGYGNFDRFALNCTEKFKEKHPQSRIIYITPTSTSIRTLTKKQRIFMTKSSFPK